MSVCKILMSNEQSQNYIIAEILITHYNFPPIMAREPKNRKKFSYYPACFFRISCVCTLRYLPYLLLSDSFLPNIGLGILKNKINSSRDVFEILKFLISGLCAVIAEYLWS